MERSTLDMSVLICAYTEERWDDLAAAIASVQRQTVQPREIIVVVDHNERLLDRVRAAFAGVQAIANGEQRGLSGARNSGIAAAHGAIIVFLDDDAVAEQTWLAQLSLVYNDPRVMGAGGAIEPAWDTARPAWFPDEFDWVVGCTYRGMPLDTADVRNLIGANISFRRAVFEGAGSFRHGIGRIGKRPLGCEETELCIRARQRWPERVMRYEPRARVQHRVPAARARWSYFRSRCFAEGLSKAAVARLVGSGDGLASERSYTMRTLPIGVARNLGQLLRGDIAAAGRAAAIVAGLAITTAGYLAGRARPFRPAALIAEAATAPARPAELSS